MWVKAPILDVWLPAWYVRTDPTTGYWVKFDLDSAEKWVPDIKYSENSKRKYYSKYINS